MNIKITIKMRFLKETLMVGIVYLLFTQPSQGQHKVAVVECDRIEINSEALNEERIIDVWLPKGYESGTRKYPVFYLIDGHQHLQYVAGGISYLSDHEVVPQMIVVGIHNTDRTRDLSPVSDNRNPSSGGAGNFLSFISDELMFYINEHYRTSGFDMLLGHSFGGTFAAYTLVQKPDLFDAYISPSPDLDFANRYVVKEAEKMLKPDHRKKKYYYMSVGNEPESYEAMDMFNSIVNDKSDGTIDCQFIKEETEDHFSVTYLSIFKGLKYIFSDWPLDPSAYDKGLQAIDNHYNYISEKYNYDIETPELIVNLLGYKYLWKNEVENAIAVFKENVKRFPNSPNVYDSLAEAYKLNNQIVLSKEYYKKAHDMAESSGR